MLKCTKCQKEKIETDFHLKTNHSRGRQFQCKDCRIAYGRQWYKTNRTKLCQSATDRKIAMRHWFAELKSKLQCIQCGFDHPAALVFHHRDPSQKNGNISVVVFSWEKKRILKEIEKCDVLCANCRRVLHFKLRNSLEA